MNFIKPYLNITLGVVLIALLGYSHYKAYSFGGDHIQVKLDILQKKIDKSDQEAKEVQRKQEENTNAIANEINDSVNRIHKYYRMLPRADKVCSNTPPNNSSSSNGQATESNASGTSLEERCTLDALQIIEWQNWALINKFPLEK